MINANRQLIVNNILIVCYLFKQKCLYIFDCDKILSFYEYEFRGWVLWGYPFIQHSRSIFDKILSLFIAMIALIQQCASLFIMIIVLTFSV